MPIMTDEDKKLFEKVDKIIKSKPSEQEATNFWLGLGIDDYDRLIYLFENNEINEMGEEIRLRLISGLKRLREGLVADKNRKLDEM